MSEQAEFRVSMRDCNCQGLECINPHHYSYALACLDHGKIVLSGEEYMRQLKLPDAKWECPYCHQQAEWDDDHYEEIINREVPRSDYECNSMG